MQLLSDIITYVRRIIKTPSNASISDNLIIDYINRFWITDVDARLQLFDLKTKYQFQTTPGIDKYNMPLYNVQSQTPDNPDAEDIGMYPVYQGFLGPVYVNGVVIPFLTQKNGFYNIYPDVLQYQVQVETGNVTAGPYTFTMPIGPGNTTPVNPPVSAILRGHIDMAGIIATGDNIDPPVASDATFAALLALIPTTSIEARVFITSTGVTGSNVLATDCGVTLNSNNNLGLLIEPGLAPYGNSIFTGSYDDGKNTINYLTGEVNVTFNAVIPDGVAINAQCYYFQTGLPRSVLYYNNCLTFRSAPDRQYLIELDAYLSPAAFFNTAAAIPFGYMAEYIARGAARKILSDTGDVEQFMFYEPLFKEQELLVWKRSQRQWTATRTETIYSGGMGIGQGGYNNLGNSSF